MCHPVGGRAPTMQLSTRHMVMREIAPKEAEYMPTRVIERTSDVVSMCDCA